jgi:hypothetical protein
MAKQNDTIKQITKQLQNTAKKMNVNLTKVVEDKLLETYKTNVLQSYASRSRDGNYENTGTFLDSIYVKTEDNEIAVMIRDIPYERIKSEDNIKYQRVKSTVDIHTFLTEGTQGGGEYPYETPDGEIKFAHNNPMPKHMFEEHTIAQMDGFLDSLLNDIEKGKYI